jgi:hypothetical protein
LLGYVLELGEISALDDTGEDQWRSLPPPEGALLPPPTR